MFEYNDSLHRARRLDATSCDLTKKTTPTVAINSGDVMIYLRWLVTHQRSTRTLSSFITVRNNHLQHIYKTAYTSQRVNLGSQ